eukprot:235656_1
MGHWTLSPTNNVLIVLCICCIHILIAQRAHTNYSFTLHTRNLYTNYTSRHDLEHKVTHSFIRTLSNSFNLKADDFAIHLSTTNASPPSNHSTYSISITDLVLWPNSESSIDLLFEADTSIASWNFDEYIFYNFLYRSLSHTLNTSTNYSILLQNVSCLQIREYTTCPRSAIASKDWRHVTNDLFRSIYKFLQWIFSGILGVACLFVITAYIHSWIVWNEDICIGNAIFFCFATFDWYSDILFTFSIPVEYIWLWLISFCLLFFPLVGNVAWLVSQQKLWEQDAAMGARVKAWMIRWRPFLYSMTIISGSAFGSINVCNSNMWGYPLFRMGLRNMHLERFDSKRLFITVLGENVPQLFLQGFYWFWWNQNFLSSTFDEDRLILTLAMISGIISILYAFGVIYSSKATLSRFNDNEEELFEFNIISSTDWPTKDKRKNRAYKYKLYPLRKAFASLLQLDVAYVELHPPVKIEYGYQLRFTLMVKDLGGNQVALQTLKDLIEYKELGEKIQDVWKLQTLPRIEELKWKKDRKRDYQENMVLIEHSSVPLKKASDVSASDPPKKGYFDAPDPSVPKLPEAISHSHNVSSHVISPHVQHSQSHGQLHQWNMMPSFSQPSAIMHSQSAAQHAPASSSLYSIVTAPKVQKVVSYDKEEKAVEKEHEPPPPPPATATPQNRLNAHSDGAQRGLSIASIGSVGSEARWQQQLWNHIRKKNNVNTNSGARAYL